MTAEPFVSILMSVYNTAPLLEETCTHLLKQSYTNFEVVVVNDGSTDNSQHILEDFAQKDGRFRVVKTPNQGPSRARNHAFSLSRGEYIAIVDSDDICKPFRLEKQVQFLQANSHIKLVGSYYKQINSKGQMVKSIDELPVESDELKEYLQDRNPICHGTIMITRDVFEELGGYRPIMYQAEDYDLFLRVIHKYDIALLPEVLYYHRIHENSLSTRKRLEQLQMRNFVMTLYQERCLFGVERLEGKTFTEQQVELQRFFDDDMKTNRQYYGEYLSELGRKYYRIGEVGAAFYNLQKALSLASIQPRTLRYFLKTLYHRAVTLR